MKWVHAQGSNTACGTVETSHSVMLTPASSDCADCTTVKVAGKCRLHCDKVSVFLLTFPYPGLMTNKTILDLLAPLLFLLLE